MQLETMVGLLAGGLTTIAFFPQALKCWKTKSTKDISFPTFVMMSIGIFLWLTYGLMIGDLPIITANIFSIVLVISIVIMKMKYG